jgi:hypothetical protein
MENRWTGHVRAARQNTDNTKFYNAIRKYGADPWTHESLVQTKSQAESDSEEIRYIDEYDTFHNGYNGTKGGGGTSGVSGKNNHRYDHTVYLIVKPHATGEIFDIFPGTRQEILAAIPELTQSGLSGLLSGDQKIHKGWRLPKTALNPPVSKMSGKNHYRYDPTVRTIEKPDATGVETKEFTGTRQEMLAAIPELTPQGLSGLLSREQEIHKGWKLKYIHLTFRKRRHLLILD